MMNKQADVYDVIVVGGGPTGATAALRAARNGLSVAMIEKDHHPRFHIGESFLPRCQTLMRELGLDARLAAIRQVPKYGASFVMGNSFAPVNFWFANGPRGEEAFTCSIERAPFDQMLWEAAREAGVDAFENTSLKSIDTLEEGNAAITTSMGLFRGRMLLDASGQGTVVGRHLDTRRTLPDLRRVAFFQHFTHAKRREGKLAGSPIMVMAEEGWFWVIPIDEQRTSIGLVMGADEARTIGFAPAKALEWGIARCPFLSDMCSTAVAPPTNHICADFSYRCEPFAGPGYFLVGDAATFVDPIFSTGVCLGMMSGVKAADFSFAILKSGSNPKSLRREYMQLVDGSSSVFFKLVRNYYRHEFRELFLSGEGPLGVHRAVLQALAGHVFPKPVFATRWRLKFFELLLAIQTYKALAPRQPRFSLKDSAPQPQAWAQASLLESKPRQMHMVGAL